MVFFDDLKGGNIRKAAKRSSIIMINALICILDIISDHLRQLCLFQSEKYNVDARKRMQLIDHINGKFGNQTLRIASESKKRWYMHQDHLSPRYTTCRDEFLEV